MSFGVPPFRMCRPVQLRLPPGDWASSRRTVSARRITGTKTVRPQTKVSASYSTVPAVKFPLGSSGRKPSVICTAEMAIKSGIANAAGANGYVGFQNSAANGLFGNTKSTFVWYPQWRH